MEYLREREMKLRDTNESTNERVKWFAIGTMGTLISLAAWQVVYLRAYFRCVDLLRILMNIADAIPGRSISSKDYGIVDISQSSLAIELLDVQ